ncbi:hypothetical protein E2562_000653 [Oryza meyeriana var. granulata]|uniref:Uncharacterized protein n=1 Tax=Oryza meyeriana var. granulata TaxID=110450 RepID=A0A6G1DWG7_9ORYZ|nr:hypothetical protein E2562_000653 [Oryza meyeriana var. granulata]
MVNGGGLRGSSTTGQGRDGRSAVRGGSAAGRGHDDGGGTAAGQGHLGGGSDAGRGRNGGGVHGGSDAGGTGSTAGQCRSGSEAVAASGVAFPSGSSSMFPFPPQPGSWWEAGNDPISPAFRRLFLQFLEKPSKGVNPESL